MIKRTKTSLLVFGGILLIFQNNIVNAVNFGRDRVNGNLEGTSESAPDAIQMILIVAMSFLYLLAVIYGLWGGFNVMTAGGDEEKVKKGKKIIIHAVIGLVVIWLSSSIINWVVTQLLGSS